MESAKAAIVGGHTIFPIDFSRTACSPRPPLVILSVGVATGHLGTHTGCTKRGPPEPRLDFFGHRKITVVSKPMPEQEFSLRTEGVRVRETPYVGVGLERGTSETSLLHPDCSGRAVLVNEMATT